MKALVSLLLVNTGRREDIRLPDGRHQTYIHYSRTQGGSGAWGARVQAVIGLTPWAPPVSPAERAGSEGREKVLKIDGAFAPRVLRFDSGFAAEGCGGGSAASIYAACRQRWWTPLKMKGVMMIKLGSRPAGEARLYGFPFRGAELQNSSPEGRYLLL